MGPCGTLLQPPPCRLAWRKSKAGEALHYLTEHPGCKIERCVPEFPETGPEPRFALVAQRGKPASSSQIDRTGRYWNGSPGGHAHWQLGYGWLLTWLF